MNAEKNIARVVGSLFLVSMTASLIYVNFFSAVLSSPLVNVYPNRNQMVIGAILELINCLAVVGIAVMLFSILKKFNKTIAIAYVGFRTIECTILIVGVISSLLLIALSQEYINAGAPDISYFQTIGALIITGKHMALQLAIIFSSLSGLMLTYSLYQTLFVPRFLSAWGFVGYVLVLTSALLDIFGIIDTVHGAGIFMYLPGGLFETILFPIWLIVKGFNPSAIAMASDKTNLSEDQSRYGKNA